eukprot:Nk52_evm8s2133 gene=Nk52_evmTU8s2133
MVENTGTPVAEAPVCDENTAPVQLQATEEGEVSKEEKARQDWVIHMRKKFCVRTDTDPETYNILLENGELNPQYFMTKTKKVAERKWTDKEKDLLLKGIEEYGIGNFGEISKALLPDWTRNDLRVKAMRLMGRQNLSLYKGWKGNKAAIEKEFNRNKEIGDRHGCWKGGMLTTDDAGKVERDIMATEPSK